MLQENPVFSIKSLNHKNKCIMLNYKQNIIITLPQKNTLRKTNLFQNY